MKDGSGSASAPSAGVNSLAITERQKPVPTCVASLLQMFAKRKLFSSNSKKNKLLPPVRARKFSPGRPPGGGDTSPAAKRKPLPLDSVDYSRRKSEGSPTNFLPPPDQEHNCSEMRPPGIVARLMGLSSMPASNHQKSTKVTEPSKLGDHRNAGSQDWSGTSRSIYTSPQKQQKTERLVDDKRHGNASQFIAPDTRPSWPRRHAHKIASPVKSPRSMSRRNKARLIEAAAKVLEPGLQSKNHHLSRRRRHAYLEYSCNGGDGAPGAAAVLHNTLSGQFLAGMCDVDAPVFGAHSIGATSLHNSTSSHWTEEVGKCSIQVKRSDKDLSCQMQPEGNTKCLLVSLSEKPGFGDADTVQRTTNCVSATNQDIRRNQLKNMSPGSVSGSPLKQNNQKQNALPAPCREADPGYAVQRHKHRSRERNTGQDFVSPNKRMTGSTSLRSKRKVIDRFGESHTSSENKNVSTKGRQTSSQHSNISNKLQSKTAAQRATEKGMIIAKGAGLVSEKPKPASPNCASSDLQRQAVSHNGSRCNKKSGMVSFTFSSSMKVAPTSLPSDNASRTGSVVQGSPVGTCHKRHSSRDGQSMHLPRELDFSGGQGTSSLETAESVFLNQDKLKHRGNDGRAASSLFEKKSVVTVTVESSSDEQQWQCNSVDHVTRALSNPCKADQLRETRKKHEADAKGRGSNKRSPTSNVQSTYADDAFMTGIAVNTVAGAFTDSRPVETCIPAPATQNVTSEGNSSRAEPNSGQHGAQAFEPAVQDSKLTHPGEVTSTVELLLSNVCSPNGRQSKESSKTFLLQTIESTLATLTTSAKQDFSITKAMEASPLRDLAIDFVLELLDLTCAELCDAGYRSFSKLALICKEERLAAEIRKEIAKCSDMAGRALDDLAVSDVEHTVEAGMNSMLEAFQLSAQIEQDLVQELVNEIGVDMFKRL